MNDPILQITQDRQLARSYEDSNAELCMLALTDGLTPSVRTLVLRDVTADGLSLYINKTSHKWRIIEQNHNAELLIWYQTIQRQYRVAGTLHTMDPSIIEGNWHRRPAGSKYLDHAYERLGPQSSPIDSQDTLVQFIKGMKAEYHEDDLPTPASAIAVRLVPTRIECLDLNNQDRIHDRRLFHRTDQGWEVQQLVP